MREIWRAEVGRRFQNGVVEVFCFGTGHATRLDPENLPKSAVSGQCSGRRTVKAPERFTVEYTVEQSPHMETIQVVLDSKLLRATEVAARRTKLNRSALIREALRAHLKNLETRERELRDRKGYESGPRDSANLPDWEEEAVWPEE